MAKLEWDKPGERRYHTGVDRGVLYLHDGTVAVWNGLTGVEDSTGVEIKPYYLEGVKFLENVVPGDYEGKLRAYTYPDEFDNVNGIAIVNAGLAFYEQPSDSFNLTYRTMIGDDIEGLEHGYKIHILYNVHASPDPVVFNTLSASGVEPTEFSWSLSGTPPKVTDYRPTVHISLDSLTTPPEILQILEDTLYGTDFSDASLPSIQEIYQYFGYLGALLIVDHGDGTWSAIDQSDTYITMLDDTTFKIDNADVTYLDPNTYTISTTGVD